MDEILLGHLHPLNSLINSTLIKLADIDKAVEEAEYDKRNLALEG